VKCAKTYLGANCDNDHNPVVIKLEVRPRNLRKSQEIKRLDLKKPEIRHRLQTQVLQNIDRDVLPDKLWEATRIAMRESAEENLSVKKAQKPGKGWMTEAILELMEKRRVEKG